jgi:hypothetical protein
MFLCPQKTASRSLLASSPIFGLELGHLAGRPATPFPKGAGFAVTMRGRGQRLHGLSDAGASWVKQKPVLVDVFLQDLLERTYRPVPRELLDMPVPLHCQADSKFAVVYKSLNICRQGFGIFGRT